MFGTAFEYQVRGGMAALMGFIRDRVSDQGILRG